MESIIIAAPRSYDSELERRLEKLGPLGHVASGGVFLEDEHSRLYFSRNDAIALDLEPAQLARIVSIIPEPIFFIIDFIDIRLCRKVISEIADDPLVVVDNDHGTLLAGKDFVRVLVSKPDWDWRISST